MTHEPGEQGVAPPNFDTNRSLIDGTDSGSAGSGSAGSSCSSHTMDEAEEGLLGEGVEEPIDKERAALRREVSRYVSFGSSILSSLCAGSITSFSLYGPLFLSHLRYNQYEINTISVAAELAMYLPVPVFGYLVDRYSPRPVALFSAILFGFGYLLAALTYRSGPPDQDGWPVFVMVLAFCAIGMGTASMYLAAVTACAKNFSNSKYKGVALSLPIASFGLSGMWQSQVGSHWLSEVNPDGSRGDVDVFKYFIFLGVSLFSAGLVASVAQKVVNEEELIDEAVDELQRSGLLEESPFFQNTSSIQSAERHYTGYGTIIEADNGNDIERSMLRSWLKADGNDNEEERLKKTWLLNGEARRFLTDHTMWLLAFGFFLVSGPVETFINNCGTMLSTLYAPPAGPPVHAAAEQVSILAISSTLARLAAGLLSDLVSPPASQNTPQYRALTPNTSLHSDPFAEHVYDLHRRRFSISRLTLLISTAALLSIAYALLFSPLISAHPPLFSVVTALIGLVNGASFALVPLLISAVWGVQNFGTNWGIVAMMPALGATLWSALYSVGYQAHAGENGICSGQECYRGVVGGMMGAGLAAMLSWIWIGWGKDGWWKRGVVV